MDISAYYKGQSTLVFLKTVDTLWLIIYKDDATHVVYILSYLFIYFSLLSAQVSNIGDFDAVTK